jgi:hypothetical protein
VKLGLGPPVVATHPSAKARLLASCQGAVQGTLPGGGGDLAKAAHAHPRIHLAARSSFGQDAQMTPRRIAGIVVAALGVIVLAPFVLLLGLQFTGPFPPSGATRLHIATETPNLTPGCAAALLAPARVTTDGDDLTLVAVGSGETLRVVWPSGFGAWRSGGRAVVADQWGRVVGREGDVLDSLGGGLGPDGVFHICPFGIVIRS